MGGELVKKFKYPGDSLMESSSSGSLKRARTPGNVLQVPLCSVDGCTSDLSKCKDYHRRHKVCELHSKAASVFIKGQEQRFCQLCSRFHLLGEFDEGKRTCRKRLAGHNERRRKPRPDSLKVNSLRLFPGHQGVQSASLGEQDKNLIGVIGDVVDAVGLSTSLRKELGYTELVSVNALRDQSKQKKQKYESPLMIWDQPRVPSSVGKVAKEVPLCSVDGCTSDLSKCKDYHRRHKVCELHSKAASVFIKGQEQRFCQQCCRFHSVWEIDEGKRSCRRRLAGHNRLRRMIQPVSLVIKPGALPPMFSPPAERWNHFVKERMNKEVSNAARDKDTSNHNVPRSSFECHSGEGKGDLNLKSLIHLDSHIRGLFNKKGNEIILGVHPSRPLALQFCAEILVELNLSRHENDKQRWPGRQPFVNLEELDLNNSNLTLLPDLSEATKLKRLNLQDCKILVEVSSIQHLTKIEHLNLKGCTSLRSLPSFIGLKFLSALDLSDCSNLKRLPLSLGCLFCLAILDVRNCKRLQHIPISILRLKSLHSLDISGCLNLMKRMTGNEMGEVSSAVVHTSLIHRDNFVLGSSTHSGISSEDNPVQPQQNSVNNDRLHVPAAMVSNSTSKTEEIGALPQVEAPLLDQPVIQYTLKRSLNLLEEECISDMVDFLEETLLKRRTSTEMKSQNSQHSSLTERESSNNPTSLSFMQMRKALEGYMNMSLEDIHQADAFEDIESLVNTLIQEGPNLHDGSALQDLLCCVEEYKVDVPDTMTCMKATRTRKTSLQAKLTCVGTSLVQAEEQYSSLQARLTTLSEEEEELEAEIERLLAKKKELLDQDNSLASQ